MNYLDEDGQQINQYFNQKRLNDRTVNELIGISRGVIADGEVVQAEAEFLFSWMENNARYHEDKIINALYIRIREMLADNHLDQDEQKELLETLREITGETCPADQSKNTATTFPLDKPQPSVIFQDHFFCLTGKFAYAPRKVCEQAVTDVGGQCHKNPTTNTHYLVIGTLCSRDWAHSSYGRKIERAMEIREAPYTRRNKNKPRIAILHEDYWIKCLTAELL